jgi:hypothetical protein
MHFIRAVVSGVRQIEFGKRVELSTRGAKVPTRKPAPG